MMDAGPRFATDARMSLRKERKRALADREDRQAPPRAIVEIIALQPEFTAVSLTTSAT